MFQLTAHTLGNYSTYLGLSPIVLFDTAKIEHSTVAMHE